MATPPCIPFLVAGGGKGWKSRMSQPFIACVNLIKELYNKNKGRLTYIIENVPSAKFFTAISETLREPILLEATELGSVAKRTTALWTNGASMEELLRDYRDKRYLPHQGLSIQELLEGSPEFDNRNAIYQDQRKFPKFMAR